MKKFLIFSFSFFIIAFFLFLFTPSKIQPEKISEIPENVENFIENKIKQSEPIEILFVGDMMFDRGVRFTAQKSDYDSLLKSVSSLFEEKDLIVGNLEGTITNNQSVSLPNSEILRFTFDPIILKTLKKYNFGLVSLANNHSLDFYADGLQQTKNNLDKFEILYFGSAMNNENLSKQIILEDKNFCFIGYHDLYTKNEKPALEEIQKIRSSCYKIIVFPHWGEEYLNTYTKRQQELAHKFIDEGADLIIGSHPHVVEPFEEYKGKAIFYSLGNFIFDQYFSFETTHSFALKVIFEEDLTNFEIIPIGVNMGVVSFAEEEDSKKILNSIDVSSRFNLEF